MASEPKIVDGQLHDPSVWLGWDDAEPALRRRLLTELTLASMEAVGVDCAVLFPVDLGWGEEAATQLPDRFAVVRMITPGGVLDGLDPADPEIEERVAEEAQKPTTVGMRILPAHLPHDGDGYALLRDGLYDRALGACERLRLPVFISTMGNLTAPADIAERFLDLTLIVDHFGMLQPPVKQRDSPPFLTLPALLALAERPNVAVKLCGAPALSETPFPYPDVWPHLEQILDAFGASRLLWASDISRFRGRVGFDIRMGEGPYEGKHTYGEALHYLRDGDRLSEDDRRWIFGGTVQKLLGWPA